MEPDKRRRGARDENSDLVQEIVEGVEVPVCREWDAGAEGIEEGWGDTLVDCVFGYINEEEGEHVWEEQRPCSMEI